jgi:hypothetical protein
MKNPVEASPAFQPAALQESPAINQKQASGWMGRDGHEHWGMERELGHANIIEHILS